MFCRRGDGGWTSREHVIPESMGNTELILPPGVVCGRCNSGVLSEVDQALCDFPAVSWTRTLLGVVNKSGKVPVVRASEGTLTYSETPDGPDAAMIRVDHRAGGPEILRETARHPDGRVELQMKVSGGKRMTRRYAAMLSRALLKSALEAAWIDHGPAVLEPRFDHVRQAVLGQPRDGFFTVMTKAESPQSSPTRLHYWLNPEGDDPGRLLVALEFHGIKMATDSRLVHPRAALPGIATFAFTTADWPANR